MCQINLYDNLGGSPDPGGRWYYTAGLSPFPVVITDETTGEVFSVNLGSGGTTPIVPDTSGGNGRWNLLVDFGDNYPGTNLSQFTYRINPNECLESAVLNITNLIGPQLGPNVVHNVCVNAAYPPINMFNLLDAVDEDGQWAYNAGLSTMANLPSGTWNVNNASDPTDDTFDPNASGLITPGVYVFDYSKTVSIPAGQEPEEGICSECSDTVRLTFNVEEEPNPGTDNSTSICL